jgi:hypothetical protein
VGNVEPWLITCPDSIELAFPKLIRDDQQLRCTIDARVVLSKRTYRLGPFYNKFLPSWFTLSSIIDNTRYTESFRDLILQYRSRWNVSGGG